MAAPGPAGGDAAHCILHTPLAYLCAREYLAEAGFARRYLYVIPTSRPAADQIRALAAGDDWTRIVFLREGRGSGRFEKLLSLARLVKVRVSLEALLARIPAGDTIVLSHLNNPYSRLILQRRRKAGAKVTVVDDGTTTLEEFGALAESGTLRTSDGPRRHDGLHAQLERLLFSSRDIHSDDVAFFSFWPLQAQGMPAAPELLPRNSFPLLRARLRPQPALDCVYFVGQPFVRRGLLSEQDYAEIVFEIAAYYRQLGLDLVYFPHRNEDPQLIARQLTVNVSETPFEIHLLKQDALPATVAGFFSACVLTSCYIFGDRMGYEVFWGFDKISPGRACSLRISQSIEAEAARSPSLSINRALGSHRAGVPLARVS